MKWIQDCVVRIRDLSLENIWTHFEKKEFTNTNHRNKVQLTLVIQPCIYNVANMPWMNKSSIDIHEYARDFFFLSFFQLLNLPLQVQKRYNCPEDKVKTSAKMSRVKVERSVR